MDINHTSGAQSPAIDPPIADRVPKPVTVTEPPVAVVTVVANALTSEPPPLPKTPEPEPAPPATHARSILVVDVGGTKVKILAANHTEPRKASTGKEFTPGKLVDTVKKLAEGWEYDCVSLGYPGLVGSQGPRSEPGNLGPGWVGFDFASAFGKPVKIINDAAMQALGSFEGGRMLFIGLGTGVGSTLITGHIIVPLELGSLNYDTKRTVNQMLGRRAFARLGKYAWREAVNQTVTMLMRAFVADYIVVGGGNAKNVKNLPHGARRGHNLTAFRGGFRLWNVEDVWVLASSGDAPVAAPVEMRVL